MQGNREAGEERLGQPDVAAAAGHTAACVSAKVEGRGGVTLERERLSSFILGMNSGVWFFSPHLFVCREGREIL